MTKPLTTVAMRPCWCTKIVNKLVASFAKNVVLCLVVGCGRKSGRDEGICFARVPSIVTNQGEKAQELSGERRSRWISAISCDKLTEEILEPIVFAKSTSFQEERLKAGINLILTGSQHYIWDTRKLPIK